MTILTIVNSLTLRRTLGGLALGAVVAAVAAGAFLLGAGGGGVVQGEGHDGEHSGEEVRVQARAHEDGRVEVAVQQRGEEGWGERQLPSQRFLPADAPSDEWIASSGVVLADSADGGLLAHPTGMRFCFIDHGPRGDIFWTMAQGAALGAAKDLGADLRVYTALSEGGAAAAIRECVADGVDALAVTLADADAVAEAIAEANAAGIGVVTFNSGSHLAESVGSAVHVGPPDFSGGVLVGEQLNAMGLSGPVVCVLHEANNAGLDARCDGLEAAYDGGAVERMTVAINFETGDGILQEMPRMLARARDPEQETPAAWIGLNGGMTTILSLINKDNEDLPFPVLAGFGFVGSVIPDTIFGNVEFFLWDSPLEQGYHTVMAMQYVLNLSRSFPRAPIGVVAENIGTIFVDIPAVLFTQPEAVFLGTHLQTDGDFIKLEADWSAWE